MKEQKQSSTGTGLVVGNVSRRQAVRLKLKQYWKPLVIVGVIILAGGAGVAVRLLQNKTTEQQIVFPGKPLPQKVDDAQNLRATGDIAGSAKVIEEGLADPNTSNDERYLLYIQQGNLASDKADYTAAGIAYERAAAVKKTYEIYTLLGANARYAKDAAKAVEYYKQALPLINPKSPLAEADRESLQKLITSLETGKPQETIQE